MNITITSTQFTVTVNFNSYSSKLAMTKVSFRRNEISKISHVGDSIIVNMLNDVSYRLSFADNIDYAMTVDSIDGVDIISNDDLYNKLVILQDV